MRTREEAVRFLERQFNEIKATYETRRPTFYGAEDFQSLFDFIYEGPPRTPSEEPSSLRVGVPD